MQIAQVRWAAKISEPVAMILGWIVGSHSKLNAYSFANSLLLTKTMSMTMRPIPRFRDSIAGARTLLKPPERSYKLGLSNKAAGRGKR